jgi:TorA maturation chaperone TorD
LVGTETPASLSPRLLAIARGRACDLFGLTLLQGIRVELLPALMLLPGLGSQLADPLDMEQAEAEQYRVLEGGVRPIESLFLGSDGLVGGDLAGAVRREMLADGLHHRQSESPDHLGLQLSWLSHLLGAEADAHEDGRIDLAMALRQRQRSVMDGHLMRFILPFFEAVSQLDSPFYTRLADLVLQFLCEMRGQLEGSVEPWELSEPPHPLTHPGNGLREIAAWLCIPSWSGVYLSLDFITDLGRRLEVPSGFGSRVNRLESLLHGAVRFEQLPTLLHLVDDKLEDIQSRRESSLLPVAHRSPWQERLAQTRTGLSEIAEGARA